MKTDRLHAGTPATQGEKTVSELAERVDHLSASIDRIINTSAHLRNTELTAQQAHYVRLIEQEIQSLSAEVQRINTEFNFNKPIQRPANQPVQQEKKSISGARVLLVEDDLIIRTVGINILNRNGVNLTIAENGKAATELTASNTFDIILMDIQMPVMNGFDATRIIRQEQNCTTPIIGLTANTVQNAEDQYYQAGMNDVMSKPYNQDKLVSIIHKWLNTQNINKIEASNDIKSSDNLLFSIDKLRDIGDKDFVNRMLQLFVEQVSPSVPAIRKAYNDRDFAAIKYLAHRIRPSILNMGIESVKREITEIEELAKSNESSTELDKMISKLESVMAQVTIQVRQLLD